LVKDTPEAADCRCRQGLFSLVNQSFDTQIGTDTQLKAVDIAGLMDRQKMIDILNGKKLTGVRSGRAIPCNVG